MQTATNPDTGERVILIGNEWKPIESSATDASGKKAYLAGGAWHTEEARPVNRKPPVTPEFEKEAQESLQPNPLVETIKQAFTRIPRAAGLTARAGIEGVGGMAALPMRAAETGLEALGIKSPFSATRGMNWLSGKLPLPTPENPGERMGSNVARTVAGAASGMGLAGGIAPVLQSPVARGVAEQFAANPTLQATSAAGAGAGESLAKESGAGQWGQLGAAFAGSLAAPASIQAAKSIANHVGDLAGTIAASFGNQRGINRLAKDAAEHLAGADVEKIKTAIKNASEFVKGAKPTVGEAIAEANIGKPSQFGGETVAMQKALSGYPGMADILPSVKKAQGVAVAEHIEALNNVTGPMRERALRDADFFAQMTRRLGGLLRPEHVTDKIDDALRVPGQRASDVVQKSLNATKEKIKSIADDEGIIDARDLYTVRKEVGNIIENFVPETKKWDKKLTAGLEREIQKFMDDAIEAAGGTGWKNYLKTHAEGMRAVDNQLARTKEMKLMMAGVKSPAVKEVTSGEVPKLPTLLHRPMMAINYALRMVSQDANTPVARELAKRMADPQEFAKLLKRPPTDPLKMAADDYLRRGIVAATIAESDQQ